MASLALAAVAIPLSLLLLFVGQSFESTLFGLAGLLLGLGPLILVVGKERESTRLEVFGALVCLGWMILTGWLAVLAPDGKASATARIQHRYVSEDFKFRPHALGNLLPELDQFLLGLRLLPWMDRLLTVEQGRDLAPMISRIYQELEADADFHALGSVMSQAYDDQWFQRSNHGHYFLYVPEKVKRNVAAPVLIFLHGSGGNFKAYPWLLSKVADDLGMVLICPSYGMGNWTSKQSVKVVEAALEDARKVVKLDRDQMHLMGLSNGGLGMSHVAHDLGKKLRSATFISPVIQTDLLDSPNFGIRWKGKPLFILTGEADDRVPVSTVEAAAVVMQKRHAVVTMKIVPYADHFLLFSHRDEVISQLKVWLASAMQPVPPAAEEPGAAAVETVR